MVLSKTKKKSQLLIVIPQNVTKSILKDCTAQEGRKLFFILFAQTKWPPIRVLIHVRHSRQHVSLNCTYHSGVRKIILTVSSWNSELNSATLLHRLFSRVLFYSKMGKRSRQRQQQQNQGRDARDNAVSSIILLQLYATISLSTVLLWIKLMYFT